MAKQNKGRKFFAASATAALVASAIVPVASAAQFNDENKISGYAKEAVKSLVDTGVIKGDEKGNFNPTNPVTRAEAAKIFAEALELQAEGDVNFTDVKKGTWYYNSIAAVVANGIFEGMTAKEFAPNGKLTRAQAAKIMVEAFGLEGSESLSQFADASTVQPWAKSYLETAVANGIFTGSEVNGKLNLNPNSSITRQDFAVVFARTLDSVDTETPVEATSVKAINATTVEVTFEDAIEDIEALDFEIAGLEIKNAAVKQTNEKVVVLTTSAQEGEKEYTVTNAGEKLGSFKGISSVVPTSIKFTTKSNSLKVGTEYTLKADIGVKAAGVPVTFNIDAPTGSLNKDYVVEVPTNEAGIAEYSYTQYAAGTDVVSVYPTGAPTTRDVANIYWGVQDILTVKESATGNANNGTTRTYEVTLLNPVNGLPLQNQTINVALLENINSLDGTTTNDTTAVLADPRTGAAAVTPFQSTTNERAFSITTDANGKAVFTLTGANTEVTPLVFIDSNNVGFGISGNGNSRWEAGELQVVLPTVKFQGAQAGYTFDFGSLKNAEFATGLGNRREYKATVKKADGSVYANGEVKIGLEELLDANLSTTTSVVFTNKAGNTNLGQRVQTFQTNDKGEVTFYIAEPTATTNNVTATPAIWIDLDAAGNTNGQREIGEPQALAPSTTFQATLTAGSNLSVTSEPTEGPHVTGDQVNVRFELRNQSNQLSTTSGFNRVSYTVTNTTGGTVTINPSLLDSASGNAFTSLTTTFANGNTATYTNGNAITLNAGSSVTISGTAPGFTAAAGNNPDFSSTNQAVLRFAAADQANTLDISASATAVRRTTTDDARNVTSANQAAKKVEIVRATTAGNGAYTGKIIGFTTSDNAQNTAVAANYGRVIVKLDGTDNNVVLDYKGNDAGSIALGTDGTFANNLNFNSATFNEFENRLAIDNRIQFSGYNTVAATSSIRLANVKGISATSNASGNGVTPTNGNIATTGVTGTQTAPVVTLNQPLYLGGAQVANGTDLAAQFRTTGGTGVTNAIYNSANNTITFTLGASATELFVNPTSSLEGLNGTDLEFKYDWTAGAWAADTTAPTVSSAVFTNGTTLRVTFSEAVTGVDAADFTDGKFTNANGTTGTFTVSAVTGNGTNTIDLTIAPSVALSGATGTVDIATLADLGGNVITSVNDRAITTGVALLTPPTLTTAAAVGGTVTAGYVNGTNINLLVNLGITPNQANGGRVELYSGTNLIGSQPIVAGQSTVAFNLNTGSTAALQSVLAENTAVTAVVVTTAGVSSAPLTVVAAGNVDYTAPTVTVNAGATNSSTTFALSLPLAGTVNKTAESITGSHAVAYNAATGVFTVVAAATTGDTITFTVTDAAGNVTTYDATFGRN